MPHDSPARTASRELNLKLVEGLSGMLDVAALPIVNLPAGRELVRTGEALQRLPLIVSGTADAVYQMTDEGNAVVPVSWGPGELAMVSYLFSRQPPGVDVVAREAVALRWLPIEEVERCLLGSHASVVLLVRFLAQRLREVQARERAWLERGVHERVCASLARIALAMPAGGDGRVMIAATHESLAERCGVSRPRLSKELKSLEEAGRLRLGRGTVEIVDVAWFQNAAW